MKEKSIVFSIITCTLNSSEYLTECLESIKRQSFKEYEIIVVDGGSSDETINIAKKFEVDQILYDVKGGISNAMNYGIGKAKGDIISILHSDDYFENENVLKIVYNSFNENPSSLWLFGQIKKKRDNLIFDCPINTRYTRSKLLTGNFIPHPAVFVNKDLYNDVGLFDVNLKYSMDYDFLLRISKKYEPIQLFDYLAVFREHSKSTSSSNKYKAAKESFKAQRKYLGFNHLLFKAYFIVGKSMLKQFIYARN